MSHNTDFSFQPERAGDDLYRERKKIDIVTKFYVLVFKCVSNSARMCYLTIFNNTVYFLFRVKF